MPTLNTHHKHVYIERIQNESKWYSTTPFASTSNDEDQILCLTSTKSLLTLRRQTVDSFYINVQECDKKNI